MNDASKIIAIDSKQITAAAERLSDVGSFDKSITTQDIAIALQSWLQKHIDEVLAEPEEFVRPGSNQLLKSR